MARGNRAANPTLAPLRHPIFVRIWAASSISHFGTTAQGMAAAWLMASMVQSSTLVAAVQAMVGAPVMIFALIAGGLADAFDRRRLMLIAQILSAVVALVLTFMTYAGHITPLSLLVFTFAIAAGNAFHLPAWHSSVSEQVPRDILPAAISLNAVGFNLARSIAPGVGGLILAKAGAASVFLVNAISYAGVIVALLMWRRPNAATMLPREPLHFAIGAGIRFVALSPEIKAVLLRAIVFGVGASALWAMIPLIVRDLLHGGPFLYGLLLGSFGVGAFLGGLLNARLRGRFHPNRVAAFSSFGMGAATVVVATSTSYVLIVPALVMTGVAWLLSFTSFNIAIQLSAPNWVVGRILSIYQMSIFAALAGGSLLWGLVADEVGLASSLLVAASCLVVSSFLVFWVPIPDNNASTHEADAGIALAAEEPQDPGPIIVMIEYRVDPASDAAFLAEMRELSRHRRLEGARNWSLVRDVSDPAKWIERYASRDWNDHLRRRARRSRAGKAARDRVAALVPRDNWQVRIFVDQRINLNPRRHLPQLTP